MVIFSDTFTTFGKKYYYDFTTFLLVIDYDKNNIMTSQKRPDDAEISRLLHETSDEEIQESDSETEDNLLEDEVQSDAEDF